ncbi:MAG: phage holin family protein [Actinobacteria bacterium]|nr:phage holin family protein [Actinomycetota bacterium]
MIVKLLATAAGLWVAVAVVSGLEYEGDWVTFVVLALILAVVNAVLKPLAKALSFPLILLTLGLFLLVVNALMLGIVVWLSGRMDLGLTADGFASIFLGALVISVISWIAEKLAGDD